MWWSMVLYSDLLIANDRASHRKCWEQTEDLLQVPLKNKQTKHETITYDKNVTKKVGENGKLTAISLQFS